ncbi:MAG TPA: NgoMIV family type II restriction endonuclease [Flavobacteriales bacterium]|nr:NgoMIV family type II restriction endonuclease [Flavobacteriales bacterium]
MSSILSEARSAFHSSLLASILYVDKDGVPSNADKASTASIEIAKGIVERIGHHVRAPRLAGQRSGNKFEEICTEFVRTTFSALHHMRPGQWTVSKGVGGGRMGIAQFAQYAHLDDLAELAASTPALAAALGSDYLIKPDVVIYRAPEPDENINARKEIVDNSQARYTNLREVNSSLPILHASISCKWTLRSDRAQNARSEGLNLVRNRKGRLPHITVVTGEPTPNRIASIALGTGDIDYVYHFALHELLDTVRDLGMSDAEEMLNTMIGGQRLRDISDLPLDLVV